MYKPIAYGTLVRVLPEAAEDGYVAREIEANGWLYIVEWYNEQDRWYACKSIATGDRDCNFYSGEIEAAEQTDG